MFISDSLLDKLLCCRGRPNKEAKEKAKRKDSLASLDSEDFANNNNNDDMVTVEELKQRLRGGTTAVVALLRGKRLAVAWLGDSLAVLVRQRQALKLVTPHKPDQESERTRITGQGGVVSNLDGSWRVLGQLAVSRAIGDAAYKPFISSECDIKSLEIQGDEDFLILATDGLWDTLSYEEAVNCVYAYLSVNRGDCEGVGRYLVSVARRNGSADNITAVVVFLRPVPNLMEEEAQRIDNGEVCPGPVDPSLVPHKDQAPPTIQEIFSGAPAFDANSPSNNYDLAASPFGQMEKTTDFKSEVTGDFQESVTTDFKSVVNDFVAETTGFQTQSMEQTSESKSEFNEFKSEAMEYMTSESSEFKKYESTEFNSSESAEFKTESSELMKSDTQDLALSETTGSVRSDTTAELGALSHTDTLSVSSHQEFVKSEFESTEFVKSEFESSEFVKSEFESSGFKSEVSEQAFESSGAVEAPKLNGDHGHDDQLAASPLSPAPVSPAPPSPRATPDPTLEDVESAMAEIDSLPDGEGDTPAYREDNPWDTKENENPMKPVEVDEATKAEEEHASPMEVTTTVASAYNVEVIEQNHDTPVNGLSSPVHVAETEPKEVCASPQRSAGSPPPSPRSVEGFVTSVELNTEQDIPQAFGEHNGHGMMEPSGPYSVYVSSSPEPSSLEGVIDHAAADQEVAAIPEPTVTAPSPVPAEPMAASPVAEAMSPQSVDVEPVVEAQTSGVEIIHAQSVVEVVASPSPTFENKVVVSQSPTFDQQPAVSPTNVDVEQTAASPICEDQVTVVQSPAFDTNDTQDPIMPPAVSVVANGGMSESDLMNTSMILDEPITGAPEEVEHMMQFVPPPAEAVTNAEVTYTSVQEQQTAEVVNIVNEDLQMNNTNFSSKDEVVEECPTTEQLVEMMNKANLSNSNIESPPHADTTVELPADVQTEKEQERAPTPEPCASPLDQKLADITPHTPVGEPVQNDRPISPISTPKKLFTEADKDIVAGLIEPVKTTAPTAAKRTTTASKTTPRTAATVTTAASKATTRPTARTTTPTTTGRTTTPTTTGRTTTPTTGATKPGTPRPTQRTTPGGAVRTTATSSRTTTPTPRTATTARSTSATTTRTTATARTTTARAASTSTTRTATTTTRTAAGAKAATTTTTRATRPATAAAKSTTASSATSRPATARPSTTTATKPSTTSTARPASAATKSATATTKPTTRPATTRPATRPVTSRPPSTTSSRPTSAATTPTTARRVPLTKRTTTTTAATKDATDSSAAAKPATTTTRAPYVRKPLYPGATAKTAASTATKDAKNTTNKQLSSSTARSTTARTATKTTTVAPTHRSTTATKRLSTTKTATKTVVAKDKTEATEVSEAKIVKETETKEEVVEQSETVRVEEAQEAVEITASEVISNGV